jgi:endonuclease-3 related protein
VKDGVASVRLTAIYETLLARYGDLRWWPAETPFEVMAGAVLTQNTAWSNVEKAIANLRGKLAPEMIAGMPIEELAGLIRPAGFFNQKAAYLKSVTGWFSGYGFDVSSVKRQPLAKLRAELLSVKGVGRETADSILLYAFGFPTFVVDAYTFRLCERYPLDAGKSYEEVKAFFEDSLPRDAIIYNNFHALVVINAKEHCKKKTPICGGCPLCGGCERRGV